MSKNIKTRQLTVDEWMTIQVALTARLDMLQKNLSELPNTELFFDDRNFWQVRIEDVVALKKLFDCRETLIALPTC